MDKWDSLSLPWANALLRLLVTYLKYKNSPKMTKTCRENFIEGTVLTDKEKIWRLRKYAGFKYVKNLRFTALSFSKVYKLISNGLSVLIFT